MNTNQMIEEKISYQETIAKMYERWTKNYSDVINRFREAIEHLPCCTTDCGCPALHLEGWSVSGDEYIGIVLWTT